jgi:hypothetical protein
MNDQKRVLERFVGSFAKLNDMRTTEELSPIAWQLSVSEPDEYGWKTWQPIKAATAPSFLDVLYAKLPARLPPLFEKLVLSYRWAEVDLQSYRLLANPPGSDLTGLFNEMSKDSGLWDALLPAGYVQFGKGPDLDYDPVCFDIKSSNKNRDYRVVKIDHEEILCNYRVKVVEELAPSFEQLVLETIRSAQT